jgi:threonine synthase
LKPILYKSTNSPDERVTFESALLRGLALDYGLYTIPREEIPVLGGSEIASMKGKPYAAIALQVLAPYLLTEIPTHALEPLLEDAYREEKIPTEVQHVTGRTYIIWLTRGPTYSFKDYAARFFGRTLNYFLGKRGLRRTVVVATSGDTGGAVADALHGLANVDNIVFFPKGSISEGQRRQMTTLGENIYAFEVNGDFDVCQSLAKNLLGNRTFAGEVFGDSERFTSANSISVGRLLPQAVYPFYAYSRVAGYPESMLASVPSGNFGDMMGTVVAKRMGLPVSRILAGVNENTEFPEFLETGLYRVRPSVKSPSSAMIVSHPSNLARLIDFYGGHLYDERDLSTGNVVRPGVIDSMPDMAAMRQDIFSVGVNNPQHYKTMKEVYDTFGVVLDPHGAVGWRTLELYLSGRHDRLSVIYETADPGKFPEDVQQAIGLVPDLPPGMKKQAQMKERIYSINAPPDSTAEGLKLTSAQVEEAKTAIREIFTKNR